MERTGRSRLTDRQTAVLAAVERLGRPVMADLWREFPDLAPSGIKKVLDALESRGLIEHAGDQNQAYVGGVHWWSTALTPTEYPEGLAAIVRAVDHADLGLRHTADPHQGSVTLFLPLGELEAYIRGLPSDQMDRLRRCVEAIEAAGQSVQVTVSTEIFNDPEPLLAVQVRPTRA